MVERKMYIYKITCLKTGKAYIGRTVKKPHKRLLEHFSDSKYKLNNSPLHLDMKKYDKEYFTVETLCEFYAETFLNADKVELEFIEKNNTFFPSGYNVRRVRNGRS